MGGFFHIKNGKIKSKINPLKLEISILLTSSSVTLLSSALAKAGGLGRQNQAVRQNSLLLLTGKNGTV